MLDISVSYPAAGCIQLQGQALFNNVEPESCSLFVERVLATDQVQSIALKVSNNGSPNGNGTPHRPGKRSQAANPCAEIRFCPRTWSVEDILRGIAERLASRNGRSLVDTTDDTSPSQAPASRRSGQQLHADPDGVLRVYRCGKLLTTWEVRHDLPGRIRLRHRALRRRNGACQAVERELMSILGVERYKTNALTATVLIHYQPTAITKAQLIEVLDGVLARGEHAHDDDHFDLDFPLCTVSMPLAAAAQFLFPPLLPVAAALFAWTSIPTFKEAYSVLFKEKRLGVDVLDAIVVVGCLSTGSIFAGAVLCWCLSFGRILVKKTRDSSKRMLVNVFGKQARFATLFLPDGTELEVPLEQLQRDDIIVVHTGEAIPVDGRVTKGVALVDQHALTGESTPVEVSPGDHVFAATMLLAGKILVAVEKAGDETTSAQISRILNESAGYTMDCQQRGEKLADKAVVPTLALGGLGLAAMGPAGAVAVLNSDFGTGIRMAAPLGMLTSLIRCAHKGILVKDGRALELMKEVDTVLFDKTGTLTRERPEVGRVIACNGHDETAVLCYAAAAERKFTHPIARAILARFEETGLPMPRTDESKYDVGYGITVGVGGHVVRVGSARYMDMEGIALTREVQQAKDAAHDAGHTLVMVAVDDELGGAIELHASHRPEVVDIVAGLRRRGIKHMVIISGDHEGPTRKLAHELGMDEYFAEVLPSEKADYVEMLQKKGRKVCFVGDGINDSIALKKAHVSISLRGATTIATDTAQIVFMEESLQRISDLWDISSDLDRNVSRSWNMILAPNLLCILGVFTLNFGVMASVLTNNVAALAALANGMLPLLKVAEDQVDREIEQAELRLEHVG